MGTAPQDRLRKEWHQLGLAKQNERCGNARKEKSLMTPANSGP